jgi:hypothetical protein
MTHSSPSKRKSSGLSSSSSSSSDSSNSSSTDDYTFLANQATKLETTAKRLSSQNRPKSQNQHDRLNAVRSSLAALRQSARKPSSRKNNTHSAVMDANDTRVPTHPLPDGDTLRRSSRKSNNRSAIREIDKRDTRPDASDSVRFEPTTVLSPAPTPAPPQQWGTRERMDDADPTVVGTSDPPSVGSPLFNSFKIQSVQDLLHNTSSHVLKAMEQSNAIDVDTVDTVSQTAKDLLTVGSGAVMCVVKLVVLVCILAYTFAIDSTSCACADTPRKLLVQCSASVVLLFMGVVLVYPPLYENVPWLKIVLMVTTLLLAYGVVTYFPILNSVACECAQQKWQKYIGEYYVYLALVLFVLAICGVKVL